MNEAALLELDVQSSRGFRLAIIVILILLVSFAHWWTPRDSTYYHVIHVVLRKLYILPVILAAVWFELRGAIKAAAAVTVLYVPHVFFQWQAEHAENVNQVGEIVSIWAVAILSGIFVSQEKSLLRKIASTYQGTVGALVRALDVREHNTEQHSLRVSAYTKCLAINMGISPESQRLYALAALLHDIGKIGVPDEILNKPESLDDREWELIKKHPELGKDILTQVPFLNETAEIVAAHHEKYDGSGYPQGLAGDEIPQGARIFAIADVFDALTSPRPYRKPSTYEEARDQIINEKGTHFDPEVVDVFLQINQQEWNEMSETKLHANSV